MTWPASVPLRTISLGPAWQLEGGDDFSASVTIQATRNDLTFAPTGGIAFSSPRTIAMDVGEEVTTQLPINGGASVSGMWMSNGVPITLTDGQYAFRWDITITFKSGIKVVGTRTYKGVGVPAGDGALDLDMATAVASTTGTTVTVPDLVGNLQTTFDAKAAQLEAVASAPTADAMATWLADPDSPVQAPLKATYVGALPDTTVTRDATGRIQSVTEDGITETYTYDATGRLATVTRAETTKTISRDAAGNVTGVSA